MSSPSFRSDCFKAARGHRDALRCIDDDKYSTRFLDDLIRSSCQKFTDCVISDDNVRQKDKPCCLVAIDVAAFHNSLIPFMGYAPGGSRRFALHPKWSRTRTLLISMIASNGYYATLLHEGSADGENILDSISSVDISSGPCFTLDDIALHKSAIEWDNVRLRARWTAYSPSLSPRRNPSSCGAALVADVAKSIQGGLCALRGHVSSAESSAHAPRGGAWRMSCGEDKVSSTHSLVLPLRSEHRGCIQRR